MNHRFSLERQATDLALAKTSRGQTAPTRAQDEIDTATAERQARSALLREQRIARERFDSEAGS